MILTKLNIELQTYGPEKGNYTGTASFRGETGSVTLKLNQDHLDQIFRTCADSIIDTAKAAARHMTMAIIEHKKATALPVPPKAVAACTQKGCTQTDGDPCTFDRCPQRSRQG